MYRFIIKGIDGVIKHTSLEYGDVDYAQELGHRFLNMRRDITPHVFHKSDTVEVINVSVNVSLTTQNPNHLLVQQY